MSKYRVMIVKKDKRRGFVNDYTSGFEYNSLEEAKERVLKWADGALGTTPLEGLYVRIWEKDQEGNVKLIRISGYGSARYEIYHSETYPPQIRRIQ